MRFSYVAFDAANTTIKGNIEAGSLKEATRLLLEQGYFIKKIAVRGGILDRVTGITIGGVSLVEKVLFVKHLSTMVKSGINLNEALEIISDQTTSPKFRKVVSEVLHQIRAGQSLGAALEKFPRIFDPLFINIIKVGEDSGTLEENLAYLSNELEDRLELRRSMQSAAFYPVIVLTATFGLGLVLAYFVLPKITQLFKTLSFDLPLSTKILLWVADMMQNHGPVVIASIFGGLILFRFLTRLQFIKPVWHSVLLHLPIIGSIMINYNLVLINRTLGILLKSGLTIDQAITITTRTTNNMVYRRRLERALPEVQTGKRFSDILSDGTHSRRHMLFPLLVTKMIAVGERSGRLDESLSYLADYFEKEVSQTTKNLTTILEPLMLITVGLIVGFIAISVISPIYQITGKFNS